jgi:hypothetical protein
MDMEKTENEKQGSGVRGRERREQRTREKREEEERREQIEGGRILGHLRKCHKCRCGLDWVRAGWA